MAMSADEKKNTAYHEAGHALIAHLLPETIDPIHKATIIPRGRSLGMVMTLPESDRYNWTYEKAISRLVMLFGGREAEIIELAGAEVA